MMLASVFVLTKLVGFLEDEHGGVSEEGPGQGNALALAKPCHSWDLFRPM
jgi:hypothetical protein